jgi:hypothetical protein
LKKQTQFSKGQINVSVYMKADYEELTTAWARKNKPNSKPILFRSQILWGSKGKLKKQNQNRPLAGNPKLEYRNPK